MTEHCLLIELEEFAGVMHLAEVDMDARTLNIIASKDLVSGVGAQLNRWQRNPYGPYKFDWVTEIQIEIRTEMKFHIIPVSDKTAQFIDKLLITQEV